MARVATPRRVDPKDAGTVRITSKGLVVHCGGDATEPDPPEPADADSDATDAGPEARAGPED